MNKTINALIGAIRGNTEVVQKLIKTACGYALILNTFENEDFLKFLRARENLQSKDKRKRKWAKTYFKKHPQLYKYRNPDEVREMFY